MKTLNSLLFSLSSSCHSHSHALSYIPAATVKGALSYSTAVHIHPIAQRRIITTLLAYRLAAASFKYVPFSSSSSFMLQIHVPLHHPIAASLLHPISQPVTCLSSATPSPQALSFSCFSIPSAFQSQHHHHQCLDSMGGFILMPLRAAASR